MSHILSKHRRPSCRRIGMVVEKRTIRMEKAKDASFPYWLTIAIPAPQDGKYKTNKIAIPLKANPHYDARKGAKGTTFQIIDSPDGIKVGAFTDIGEECAKTKAAYQPKCEELALDFGLTTMFTTPDGGLFGRDFLKQLKVIDATIGSICKHVQRSGGKPKDSKRYRQQVQRLRGYLKTEINRNFNRIVEVYGPACLVVEQLFFQSPELSRRLNRIIQNCGRSLVATKLKALEEEKGIASREVNPAYTSQTCSSKTCGYTDRRNRNGGQFHCLFCGLRLHADVNGSRNIGSERFASALMVSLRSRDAILAELTRQFCERYPRLRAKASPGGKRRLGAPSDPRSTSPYYLDFVRQCGAGARLPSSVKQAQG